MRPNWPGSRVCRGLGKLACSSSVPVFGSTWLSVSRCGLSAGTRCHRPESASAAPAGERCPRLAQARYSDSLTLKRTHMGSSGTMVVSGCAAVGVTRPPTGTSVSPMRPAMGARMVAYSRFSSAVFERALVRFDPALGGCDLGPGRERASARRWPCSPSRSLRRRATRPPRRPDPAARRRRPATSGFRRARRPAAPSSGSPARRPGSPAPAIAKPACGRNPGRPRSASDCRAPARRRLQTAADRARTELSPAATSAPGWKSQRST